MVVSPCTTFTLPAKVASFFLSRISSDAASIWIGWSRFCEKPCIAFGTPDIAPCAWTPLQAPTASANAMMAKLREENCVIRSLRVGGLGRCGPRLRRRRFGFGSRSGRLFHDQVHHHVAFEANHLATVDDPKLVGGQRAVQQLDVDMFVRR